MVNIKRLLSPTYRLPTKFWEVPSGRDNFLKEKEYLRPKWIIKYLKRKLFCWFFIQKFGRVKMLNKIEREHKKILWINWAAPSLGDSLMDLSARIMLKGKDVVLLTHPKNSTLYKRDEILSSVYDCPKVLLNEHGKDAFDIVICDAFSPRVFKQKRVVAPNVPFVGIYGYLNGFEVHRTYFAFSRMAELVDLPKDKLGSYQVKPLLYNVRTDKFKRSVAIAVGGEWDFRTYDKWLPLVDSLLNSGFQVGLFGSKNGGEDANLIENKNKTVKNFVGKKNLTETINELSKYELFIGADGIDIDRGTTTFNELIGLSRVMADSAREVIVLVESNKIGKKIPNLEIPWQQVDYLVTDDGLDDNTKQAIEQHHVTVICAK